MPQELRTTRIDSHLTYTSLEEVVALKQKIQVFCMALNKMPPVEDYLPRRLEQSCVTMMQDWNKIKMESTEMSRLLDDKVEQKKPCCPSCNLL